MLFMKMAKLRENREDNKGFSLVELIIVIAIMVALVAMLAPQFVKYVAKSRDAVVSQAAEDVLACAKSEFALNKLAFAGSGNGTITIAVVNSKLNVTFDSGLKYDADEDWDYDSNASDFMAMCGVDTSKSTQSTLVYTITVTNNAGSPTFEMTSTNS